MTALDLIINFGRLEAAISGDYMYIYVTVAGLDVTELDRLMTEFGGASSRYEVRSEELHKWKSSSINSMKRVIIALRQVAEFTEGQPYAMLQCLTAYVTCGRAYRSGIARKIRSMMGGSSVSITQDVLMQPAPPIQVSCVQPMPLSS